MVPQAPNREPYFASVQVNSEDFAKKVLERIEKFDEHTLVTEIRQKLALAYLYYFGFDASGSHTASALTRAGEAGQLASVRVNHCRALVTALKTLIIAERVVWQPKATNLDYESLKQIEVAKSVLEYYWSQGKAERIFDTQVEEACAFTEGFIFAPWDPTLGEPAMPDPEAAAQMLGGGAPVDAEPATPTSAAPQRGAIDLDLLVPRGSSAAPKPSPDAASVPAVSNRPAPDEAEVPSSVVPNIQKSGDFRFRGVSTWNVIRETSKKSFEHLDWVIVRDWVNKYDLVAQNPELEDEIMSAPLEFGKGAKSSNSTTDDIPIFYFFHKRTPAVPEGREAVVLGNGTVLQDGLLTYEEIPLFRITPAEMTGTPFGYSQFFEILGIQELIDSLHSSAATNLTTFGTQNIIMPPGSEIPPEQVAGGLRVLYATPDGREPKALQLCATPAELYAHLKDLKHDQELLMGVNATARGDVQNDKLSGAAMALLDTKAKQQTSSLYGSYRAAVQALGNHIIIESRKRCTTPRKIALVGKDNAFLVSETEYDGKSFGLIQRVQVDLGNPLSQSIFGRTEQVKELVQMGLVQNLEQYYQVLDTGRAEPVTQGLRNELLLIKSENEDIVNGECPEAMLQDNALLHCREHRSTVASPLARKNPKVLLAYTQHIHKHYEAYFGVAPMQPQIDPMTGQPVVDPRTGEPVESPEPFYHDRMMVLLGLQPPTPVGAPGQIAPGSPEAAQAGAEAQPPAEPRGSPPGQAETAELPNHPTNPETGREWNPSAPPTA